MLAGTANIQNIKAANSTTLNLPTLAISVNTVNIGNTSGYNGNVVFSGATSLTGASPLVNVNAGTLVLGSTLNAVGGGSVQVNAVRRHLPADPPPPSRSW